MRSTGAWAALMVGAAAIVAEVVLRRTGRLAVTEWHDPFAEVKAKQIRRLSRAGGSRTVFLGSSLVFCGVDPRYAAAAKQPTTAFNAAIYRGVPSILEDWVADQVLPGLRPTHAVWGLSTLELNDNGKFVADIHQRYYAAPRFSVPLPSRVVRRIRLTRLPAAIWARRHRLPLARSEEGTNPLAPPTQPGGAYVSPASLVGEFGESLEFATTEYHASAARDAKFRESVVNDFALGDWQVGALERTARTLCEAGVRLTIVGLPHSDEYVELHPHGRADVEATRARLAEIADRVGARFLDLIDLSLPEADYADCIHLNGRGMRTFSLQLRRHLSS